MTDANNHHPGAGRRSRLRVTFASQRISIEELEGRVSDQVAALQNKRPAVDPQLLKLLREWLEST